MGFQKEVSQVVCALEERGAAERHTLLLSATLSQGQLPTTFTVLRHIITLMDIPQLSELLLVNFY